MTKDVQAAPPGRAPVACPLPDLGGVALSTLADLTEPGLTARVDAVLRDPEALTQVWCGGGPDPETAPRPAAGRPAAREG